MRAGAIAREQHTGHPGVRLHGLSGEQRFVCSQTQVPCVRLPQGRRVTLKPAPGVRLRVWCPVKPAIQP